MKYRHLWATIAFFISFLIIVFSANAVPIRYDFQGKVTAQRPAGYEPYPSDFDPDQFIAIDDTVIGSLTFDPEQAILTEHHNSYNRYEIHISYELNFSNGYQFISDVYGLAAVGGDDDSSSVTVYSMGGTNEQESQGYDMWVSDFQMSFNCSEGFSSDNLNMPNFLAENIFGNDLYAVFWGAGYSAVDIGASIDSINASPVPEPATMLLIGSGIICLAGYRKKENKIPTLRVRIFAHT